MSNWIATPQGTYIAEDGGCFMMVARGMSSQCYAYQVMARDGSYTRSGDGYSDHMTAMSAAEKGMWEFCRAQRGSSFSSIPGSEHLKVVEQLKKERDELSFRLEKMDTLRACHLAAAEKHGERLRRISAMLGVAPDQHGEETWDAAIESAVAELRKSKALYVQGSTQAVKELNLKWVAMETHKEVVAKLRTELNDAETAARKLRVQAEEYRSERDETFAKRERLQDELVALERLIPRSAYISDQTASENMRGYLQALVKERDEARMEAERAKGNFVQLQSCLQLQDSVAKQAEKARDEAQLELKRLQEELKRAQDYAAGPTWDAHREAVAKVAQERNEWKRKSQEQAEEVARLEGLRVQGVAMGQAANKRNNVLESEVKRLKEELAAEREGWNEARRHATLKVWQAQTNLVKQERDLARALVRRCQEGLETIWDTYRSRRHATADKLLEEIAQLTADWE